jgi:hypothetical protein
MSTIKNYPVETRLTETLWGVYFRKRLTMPKKIALSDAIVASMKNNVQDWKIRIHNIRKTYHEGKHYLKKGESSTRLWLQCCRAELPNFFRNGKESEWFAFVDRAKKEVHEFQVS